ncbi:MAG TPA: tripartite tricarboxylate transporter substrate binding protein [Ramlibacter sp.]|nr:tripartite tricarboxylate transporter substrate binding protein [Ramlibacter sp.]
MRSIKQSIFLGAFIAAAAISSSSWGQAYPTKPVTIRVAFPAGGPADVFIRQILPKMQAELGQSLIIENLSGAGGTIGAANVVKAPADGYTVLGHTNDLVIAPLAMASAQYKAEQLRLVAALGFSDMLLVARSSMTARTLAELVDYSRTLPNGLSLAHQGPGSTTQLAGEDLKTVSGVKAAGVPYKGTAPIVQDLLGGHVDIGFVPLGMATVAMVQQKKLIAIGIAAAKRNPMLPDVPTLSEGRPERPFLHRQWIGLLVPRATPEAVVQRLNKALTEAVQSPEFQKFSTDGGVVTVTMSAKEAEDFYHAEIRKYGELARQTNLQPQ